MMPALCLAAGCAPLHRNLPLDAHDRKAGYRFDALPADETNTDSVFVVMTFSGGGTRAAAFAYGVLTGLRDTLLPVCDGRSRPGRLLDEIDMISAVSGGSFTAMAYALWGDQVFDGLYEKRFLKRDIQLALILSLLAPRNFFRIPFFLLDRSDVAATYYDEEIFDGATFGDLLARGRRPFIVVNATDVARGLRFSFTQDDFDLLGSDLTSFPLGWAAAASSAFPLVFSPIRLKYHHGAALNAAVENVLSDAEARQPLRRIRWAKSLLARAPDGDAAAANVSERDHRYLFLLDGGLADNLGAHAFIESYRRGAIRERIEAGKIEKLIIVMVDAATEPPADLESKSSSPGLFKMGLRSGSTGVSSHSATLAGVVRYILQESQPKTRRAYRECDQAIRRECPGAQVPRPPPECSVETYLIDLSFRQIPEARRRRSFLSMATSLFLPNQDIDALITTGRELLFRHPEYQRLMDDLGR